ncbi:MAG: RnfABCDGE type electron transport complex subunit B [Burkholderiaceae bacterium]
MPLTKAAPGAPDAPVAIPAERIDALLPQTQCTQCGYAGCRPYAQAIADGQAPINRCPPGGQDGIRRLADLLGVAELPLDPACGVERPRRIARIRPELCIGCTRCIQVCPVDAIIGAARRMHTVIAEQCTGCDLCLPPCPVDCIDMIEAEDPAWTGAQADAARTRHLARAARLQRERDALQAAPAGGPPSLQPASRSPAGAVKAGAVKAGTEKAGTEKAHTEKVCTADAGTSEADEAARRKHAIVQAAIERARQRAARPPGAAS